MTPRSVPRLAVAALLVAPLLSGGCSESHADASAPGTAGGKADDGDEFVCIGWGEPLQLGKVEDHRASGLTGLAVSWQRPGVVWAVNDATHDDSRRLFAFDRNGSELETYPITDGPDVKWEDLATDGEFIYLVAPTATGPVIARFEEPNPFVAAEVDGLELFELQEPSGDPIESVFVDPIGQALFAVTRSTDVTRVLSTPLPLRPGASFEPVVTSEELPQIDGEVVGADATPDGASIALKIRDEGVLVWPRAPEASVAETLADVPCLGPGVPGKDRAVALEPGGRGYLLAPDDDQDKARVFSIRQETTCPDFDVVERSGRLRADSALELSGIVASRSQPGVLWAHNDGGDGDERNVLVAFDAQGEHIGDFALVNAVNTDWEDIALVSQPEGPDTIYIGDIGDNEVHRDSVRIIRLDEPDVSSAGEGGQASVVSHQEIELRYPRGRAHNAESLVVDPWTGDILIITKRNDEDKKTRVYRAAAPLTDDRTHLLELIAEQSSDSPLDARFVGADISTDGRELIAQVDGGDTLLWRRHPGESWASALISPACSYSAPSMHIEAVGFDGSQGGYVMVPEGTNPPILSCTGR